MHTRGCEVVICGHKAKQYAFTARAPPEFDANAHLICLAADTN